MNRKDRLKISSTPDRKVNTRNIYQASTQPISDNYDSSRENITNYDQEPISDYTGGDYTGGDYNEIDFNGDDSLFSPPESIFRLIYGYFHKVVYYFKYALPYAIVFYFIFQYFYSPPTPKITDSDISELTREIDLLKIESAKFSISATEKPFNICKLENCTSVIVNKDDLYKYGFLGFRKSNDPYIIFGENAARGDCLAFLPGEREFTIQFQKEVKIDNFHIFYPNFGNKSSAIKDFQLKGFHKNTFFDIGTFKYDINKDNCQTFDFPKVVTDRLLIKICSNNGHKDYTTVYKIYALGVLN